jgi:hypothetical protein
MSKYEEAMNAYSMLMIEAGHRFRAMDTALEGKTGLPDGAIPEFCFLQLRMLCELIALGCLTAHGDLQIGKDLRKAWQADRIIRLLEELHPDFYPRAATRTERGIELSEDIFPKEELVKLYGKCGDVLHRGTFQTLWLRKSGDAEIEEIRTWKQKIEALLSDHGIFMADGNTVALFRLWEEQTTLENEQRQSTIDPP